MNTRTYNDVVRDFTAWSDAMNRVLGRQAYDYAANGGSKTGNGGAPAKSRLPIDVWATDEAFFVNAYLPGVDPEAVTVTFEGDQLTISGELPAAEEGTNFVRRELYRGAFERQLTFNVPVEVDGIEATFQHGLLTLSIPKAEAVKPKQIKVQAK